MVSLAACTSNCMHVRAHAYIYTHTDPYKTCLYDFNTDTCS